jgi:hypothetical protein
MDDDKPREPRNNIAGDPGPLAARSGPLRGPTDGEDPLYYFRRNEPPGGLPGGADFDDSPDDGSPGARDAQGRSRGKHAGKKGARRAGGANVQPASPRRLLILAALGSIAAATVLALIVLALDTSSVAADRSMTATAVLPRIASLLALPPSTAAPSASASAAPPPIEEPSASSSASVAPAPPAAPPSLGVGAAPLPEPSPFLLPPPPPAATSPSSAPAPPPATATATAPSPPPDPNSGPLFQREN